MEIIKIQCPSCGANLESSQDSTQIFCDYCGSPIQVYSAGAEAYEAEMGRIRARSDAAGELASLIEEIQEPLLRIKGQKQTVTYLTKSCSDSQTAYDSHIKNQKFMPYVIPGAISLFMLLILRGSKASFLTFMVFLALTVVGFLISGNRYDAKGSELKNKIANNESQLERAKGTLAEYEDVLAKYPDVDIPEKYQNKLALDYIHDLFISQQAFSLEEAYGLYEESLLQNNNQAGSTDPQYNQYAVYGGAYGYNNGFYDGNDYDRYGEEYYDEDPYRKSHDNSGIASDIARGIARGANRRPAATSVAKQAASNTVHSGVPVVAAPVANQTAKAVGGVAAAHAGKSAGRAIAHQAAKSAGTVVAHQAAKTAGNAVANHAIKTAGRAVAGQAAKSAGKAVAGQAARSVGKAAAGQAARSVGKAAAGHAARSVGKAAAGQAAKAAGKTVAKGAGKAVARGALNGLRRLI